MANENNGGTSKGLLAYVVLLTAFAAGSVWLLPPADFSRSPTTLILMVALAGLTGYSPIRIPALRTTVSASDPFLFVSLAALGGMPAVLVGSASILSSMTGAKLLSDWKRVLVSLSAAVVSIVAAFAVFDGLAPVSGSVTQRVGPLFAATTAYFMINTILIAVAISIDRRKSFLSTWNTSTLWTAVTNYCGTTIAVALLFVLDKAGPAWLVLGVPPLWLFVAYYRSHRDRLREQQKRMEQILESNQKLEDQVRARTAQLATKVEELERARNHLRELANTDDLTLLPNRRRFDQYLSREMSRSKRFNHAFSLLLIDADHFKSINDDYGHPMGDLVLQQLATLVDQSVRHTDLAARYGGEEFAVVLAETPKFGALTLAKQLRQRVADHVFGAGDACGPEKVTISIGVVSYPEDAEDLEGLIEEADKRLYMAKEKGRNRVCA